MKHIKISIMAAILLLTAGMFLSPRHEQQKTGLQGYPPITLWAWERPEDLRTLDPNRYAVAYLDQTILLTDRVDVKMRRQPLAVAPHSKLIAVFRIEAHAGSADL